MIRISFFVVFYSIAFIFQANAQCDNCGKNNETNEDFCYTDSLFEKYCAVFYVSQTTFQLVKKNKAMTVPKIKYNDKIRLIDLAKDKKLKLSGLDLIFIIDALKAWEKAEREIGMNYTDSGLGIKILKQGEGPIPKPGQKVTVHYIGMLQDGTKFDSSYDREKPFSFPAGQGRVIKGWDEAISKLNTGTHALLKIPPELAYGERGAGTVIPPDATLYFEIEIISVQ
jgi:hypothetical protein